MQSTALKTKKSGIHTISQKIRKKTTPSICDWIPLKKQAEETEHIFVGYFDK